MFGFLDGAHVAIRKPTEARREQRYDGHKSCHTIDHLAVACPMLCSRKECTTSACCQRCRLLQPFGSERSNDCSSVCNPTRLCRSALSVVRSSLEAVPRHAAKVLLGFVLLCVVVVVLLVTPASDAHRLFNRTMAAMRISVEKVFADLKNSFSSRPNRSLTYAPAPRYIALAFLFLNMRNTLKANSVSNHLDRLPITLEEYVAG